MYYLKPNNLSIDTSDIYTCLKLNKKDIPKELISEFKNNLQEFFTQNTEIEPAIKFDKNNFKYIKKKYSEEVKLLTNKDPFLSYFFLNKIEIPDHLFSEEDKELIGKASLFEKNGNDWWNWGYDIYEYNQKCLVKNHLETESFQYFFSWFIVLADPFILNDKLLIEINNLLFENKFEPFEYFEILRSKFRRIFDLSNTSIFEKKLEGNFYNKKGIVNKSKKTYSIHKPIDRKKDDHFTCLKANETAILFNYMQESKIILSDKNILTNTDFSKLVSCLTGYNNENIRKVMSNFKITNQQKKNIIVTLKKLIELIDRDL